MHQPACLTQTRDGKRANLHCKDRARDLILGQLQRRLVLLVDNYSGGTIRQQHLKQTSAIGPTNALETEVGGGHHKMSTVTYLDHAYGRPASSIVQGRVTTLRCQGMLLNCWRKWAMAIQCDERMTARESRQLRLPETGQTSLIILIMAPLRMSSSAQARWPLEQARCSAVLPAESAASTAALASSSACAVGNGGDSG